MLACWCVRVCVCSAFNHVRNIAVMCCAWCVVQEVKYQILVYENNEWLTTGRLHRPRSGFGGKWKNKTRMKSLSYFILFRILIQSVNCDILIHFISSCKVSCNCGRCCGLIFQYTCRRVHRSANTFRSTSYVCCGRATRSWMSLLGAANVFLFCVTFSLLVFIPFF